MNEDIKGFFDRVADSYESECNEVAMTLLDSLELEKYPRILDLGCGKGVISNELYKRNKGEVIALDLSSKMIEYAKNRINNPHITFINADFYEFNDEKKFDAIVCFDAYPHFMDVAGFIKKANDLLKIGGICAIIHNIGRQELNKHHSMTAGKVSRLLKTPEEEIIPFLDYFIPISTYENEQCYKIVLKKK